MNRCERLAIARLGDHKLSARLPVTIREHEYSQFHFNTSAHCKLVFAFEFELDQ